MFVRATADYVTREPTLLSFRKGDIIIISNTESPSGAEGKFGTNEELLTFKRLFLKYILTAG